MNRRSVAVVVVVGAGIAAWALWKQPFAKEPSTREEPTALASTSVVTTAGAPAKSARPARDLALGRSYVYAVSATRTMGAPGAPKPTLSTAIAGTLSLTVVGRADDGAAVRVALASPTRTDVPALPSGDGSADLATPFFVVIQADGAISSWHFPRSMPGDSRRQLRSLVSTMQLVGAEGSASSWERSEVDEAGQLIASYTAGADGIAKTKLRYAFLRGPNGLVPASDIGAYDVTGGARYVLEGSGWPASVDEDTKTTATFPGGRLALIAHTRARLLSTGDARQFVGSFEVAQATFDPDTDALAEGAALARKNADLGFAGNATVSSCIDDYESASDSKGRARAVARLGALTRTKPQTVSEIRERMLSKATKESTGRALASALGGAGNPEAQRALAKALSSNDVPTSVRNDAAISLGLSAKPTPEGKAALKGASAEGGDLGSTATLALGTMASSMARDGQDATDIVQDLLAKLEAAATAEEKVLFLDALGNTGDPRALDAIRGRVTEGDANVRAAATAALRFQKGDVVDSTLALTVRDPESIVRRAALSAMAQRETLRSFEGLKWVIEHDVVADLRKTAIRVLARAVDASFEVAELLAWCSEHDVDPEVRKSASDALSHQK